MRFRKRQPLHFDTEAIKESLTVIDVLERSSLPIDPDELDNRRMPCFLHGGSNPTAFSVFDGDRAWFCHSCRKGGDVIALVAALKDLRIGDAIKVAARMAGILPGAPPDPATTAARAAARAARVAAKAQAVALRRDENVRAASDIWWDNLQKAWWGGPRAATCGAYLQSRGLEGVLKLSGRTNIVCAHADGSPATPIYTFERGDPMTENGIVNIATRHVAATADSPKVTVLAGHTTRGTFGQSAQLLRTWDGGPRRLVLVEGVADYFAGLLTFRGWWGDECNTRYPGISVVLGAHSASGLAKIVATLGDDLSIGPMLRELPIVLVSHNDGPGGAGEVAEADVCREAAARRISVERFDLGGHKDLADWFSAERRNGDAP